MTYGTHERDTVSTSPLRSSSAIRVVFFSTLFGVLVSGCKAKPPSEDPLALVKKEFSALGALTMPKERQELLVRSLKDLEPWLPKLRDARRLWLAAQLALVGAYAADQNSRASEDVLALVRTKTAEFLQHDQEDLTLRTHFADHLIAHGDEELAFALLTVRGGREGGSDAERLALLETCARYPAIALSRGDVALADRRQAEVLDLLNELAGESGFQGGESIRHALAYHRGRCCIRLGKIEEAQRHLVEAEKTDPASTKSLELRVLIEGARGR